MRIALTAEEIAFGLDIRAVLRAEVPEAIRAKANRGEQYSRDDYVTTQKILNEHGLAVPHWPAEWGGRGWTPLQRHLWSEETALAQLPLLPVNTALAGPVIATFGNEQLKRRFLPKTASADIWWCQGFSEPNAGSDLANLSTRAVLDGDHFVVTGQKVWTSNAHRSDYCLLLARSEPGSARHAGISCLLVDMRAPGITVRPLRQLTGDSEFNEVFFDGVRVPRTSLVGLLHRGWDVAVTILMYERQSIGGMVNLHVFIDRVLALARRQGGADPLVRQRLADLVIAGRVLRLTNLRYLTRELKGEPVGAEGSVLKLTFTEAYKQMAEIAAAILGPYAQLWGDQPRAPEDGRWAFQSLFAHRFGIAGGTDQIQRNIIGDRLLGLPR